jgi:hypothetical protein
VGLNLDENAIEKEREQVAQFQAAIDDPALEVLPIYGSI